MSLMPSLSVYQFRICQGENPGSLTSMNRWDPCCRDVRGQHALCKTLPHDKGSATRQVEKQVLRMIANG
ncbi:hypothetical protein CERZMDRAFT_90585 [Cercospora zeae-maydis SCOH1-5]|uniref:Uncharacterized protein n=1 Tax=Cercospora zeae-maydis SCOH1-5 TaxID=717836 RepID=A0A6A6FIB5_9PEZI|nr:hypothetical protein CERZMDRAFT_90585 [Cercospora zeae-maydis SCOH1-5]